MKIAMIFDGLNIGGIERVGIGYFNLLKKLGHEVHIYNLMPEKNEMEVEFKDELNIRKYKLPRYCCPEYYSTLVKKWWWGKFLYPIFYCVFYILIKVKKLLFKYKRENYDIVIAFSGHMNDLTLVANDFFKGAKKMCWLHGSLIEYLLMNVGFQNLYNKIQNLCVLSEYAQEVAVWNNVKLSNCKINKIYNPVEFKSDTIDENKVTELQEKYGDFILMVGRFTKEKDPITLVKAVKILHDKYKLENKLVFVGDGDEKNNVENLAQKIGADKYIYFEGSKLDVQNYYKAAHIFAFTSFMEGLPTVILEAMSHGLPIVSSKSLPGVPEILQDNKYGIMCEISNEIQLAEKIHSILMDKTLYNHYSELSYNRIEDFKEDKIMTQLKNIIDNLK